MSWNTFRPLEEGRIKSDSVDLVRSPANESFRTYIERVNPRFRFHLANQLMIEALEAVFAGEIQNLMINVPPGTGKTETCSRLFASYWMAHRPRESCGIASYGAELAHDMSRDAREYYIEAGGRLNASQKEKKSWMTEQRGACWGRGFGGAVRGNRYHLGIVDDPHKDIDTIQSDVQRERLFRWWDQTWMNRGHLFSPFPISRVVVMQRLADLDLCGWLLARPDSDKWHVLALDAVHDTEEQFEIGGARLLPDPRTHGELLLPENLTREMVEAEMENDPASCMAQYQQRPIPMTGTVLETKWFRVIDQMAVGPLLRKVIGADLAVSTRQQADFTVGMPAGMDAAGNIYLFNPYRDRAKGFVTRERIAALARFHRTPNVYVESVAYQLAFVQDIIREQPWLIVEAVDVDRDKVARARAWAILAEMGRVFLVDDGSGWINAFLAEIERFPRSGRHDDQVDAAGIAIRALLELVGLGGVGLAASEREPKRT